MLWAVAGYLALGAVAGVLAGLLGVGGGFVIVPLLSSLLLWQGVSQEMVIHIALGTSLATIMFTSLSSLRAHHRQGMVDWVVVRRISVGIVLGTLLGSAVAGQLSTLGLKIFFVVFAYVMALRMWLDTKPKPSRELPGWVGLSAVGIVIGLLSSLVGIGGGSLSVPFLIWCNVAMHRAVGTSAAIGFPIAAAGTVGYMWAGWGSSGLPSGSVGYVFLPALLGISAASMSFAPLGAGLAKRWPAARLKKFFACLMVLLGSKMLISLL